MISFLLFYIIGIPISILLHEVGHALVIILFTKEKSYVYVGSNNEENKENFRIGRIHFHINWAYFGFCVVKNRTTFTSFQHIIFLAGGPIVSLLLFFAANFTSAELTHYGTKNFLNGITFINLYLFIVTIIPIISPNWLKPYAGLPSDGYQILTVLKARNKTEF